MKKNLKQEKTITRAKKVKKNKNSEFKDKININTLNENKDALNVKSQNNTPTFENVPPTKINNENNNENKTVLNNEQVEISNANDNVNNIQNTNLKYFKLINDIKNAIIYKNNKFLKPNHSKLKFKIFGKTILNNELFSTYSSLEECNRQKRIAEELAKEAEQKAKQQKSKKSKTLSLIFFIINIVIIVAAIAISASQEEGMVSISKMFEVANLWYLLFAFLAFGLLMCFEGLRYYILIWKSTKHSRPFLSYKVAAIGRYYDNITPLATGGQPMQIYYLKKRGVKASTASTMPFAVYIFNQLLTFIISICVLIFSEKIAGGLSKGVYTAAVIGVVINSLIMFFVFTLSFSKKVGPVVTIWILKLLHKMRIIKDYTSLYRKVMRFVSEYQKTFRYFVSNIINFVLMAGSTLLVIGTKYLIPTFVVCMFNEEGFTFETYSAVFIWCVLIEAVLSYIPWPGAGGVAEVTYTTMFAYFALSSGTTLWAMLIYRLFQYYAFLIQGFALITYDFFIGNKKIEKNNERLRLIDEERRKKKLEKLNSK